MSNAEVIDFMPRLARKQQEQSADEQQQMRWLGEPMPDRYRLWGNLSRRARVGVVAAGLAVAALLPTIHHEAQLSEDMSVHTPTSLTDSEYQALAVEARKDLAEQAKLSYHFVGGEGPWVAAVQTVGVDSPHFHDALESFQYQAAHDPDGLHPGDTYYYTLPDTVDK